jgi:hypothetical protein
MGTARLAGLSLFGQQKNPDNRFGESIELVISNGAHEADSVANRSATGAVTQAHDGLTKITQQIFFIDNKIGDLFGLKFIFVSGRG